MRQVFIDTETTGFDVYKGDRLIEVAGVQMINGQLTNNSFQYYCRTDRFIHPKAFQAHGITLKFLSDKPSFADIVKNVLEFVKGAKVYMHNAQFDARYLDEELKRLGMPQFKSHCNGVFDTLLMAVQIYRDSRKQKGLNKLCLRLGIDLTERTKHGALIDSKLLAEAYLKMIKLDNVPKEADYQMTSENYKRVDAASRAWRKKKAERNQAQIEKPRQRSHSRSRSRDKKEKKDEEEKKNDL